MEMYEKINHQMHKLQLCNGDFISVQYATFDYNGLIIYLN